MNRKGIKKTYKKTSLGFSLPELIIVLLIIAIIAVFALPQIMSSQRLVSFAGLKQRLASSIRAARQDAISQRKPIAIRYDDSTKQLIISGGRYGTLGDAKNRIISLSSSGLSGTIIYGRPTGVPAAALDDSVTETNLTAGVVDITFQGDGTVRDANDNPDDNALYFYHGVLGEKAAFAISILGSSGRVKLWNYSVQDGKYVE